MRSVRPRIGTPSNSPVRLVSTPRIVAPQRTRSSLQRSAAVSTSFSRFRRSTYHSDPVRNGARRRIASLRSFPAADLIFAVVGSGVSARNRFSNTSWASVPFVIGSSSSGAQRRGRISSRWRNQAKGETIKTSRPEGESGLSLPLPSTSRSIFRSGSRTSRTPETTGSAGGATASPFTLDRCDSRSRISRRSSGAWIPSKRRDMKVMVPDGARSSPIASRNGERNTTRSPDHAQLSDEKSPPPRHPLLRRFEGVSVVRFQGRHVRWIEDRGTIRSGREPPPRKTEDEEDPDGPPGLFVFEEERHTFSGQLKARTGRDRGLRNEGSRAPPREHPFP